MSAVPYEVVYDGKDRSAFLHSRRSGIGASDVAAVLGFSKWKTPYDVWLDKTGRAERKPQTQAQEWGIALESVVARRFSVRHGHRHGRDGKPIGKVRPSPGVLRSTLWPWLLATPDRLIEEFDAEPGTPLAPLEVKTANAFVASDWAEGPPLYYLAQSQAQQLVYYGPQVHGFEHGWIVPLIGGNDMPEPTRVPFDEAFAELMIERLERWWVEHIEKDEAPALTLGDDVDAIHPARRGVEVVASPDLLDLVRERQALQPRMSADKKRDEAIKAQIKLAMLEATVLKDADGTVLVGWDLPMTPPGMEQVVDLALLQAEHPEAYAAVVSERAKRQSRTMTFAKPKRSPE